jgi:predicted O-methyltransferase YrrM
MIRQIIKLRRLLPEQLCRGPVWRGLRSLGWRIFWLREDRKERQSHGGEELPALRGSERATLVEQICDRYPFTSLLEIGSGLAVNFHILHRLLPAVQLMGIESDASRVEAANKSLTECGVAHAVTQLADARSLGRFPDKSFDLVISCASLLYIEGTDISTVLAEMLRLAKRTVLLLEQNIDCPHAPEGVKLPGFDGTPDYWIRDYNALLAPLAPHARIQTVPIPHPIWVTEKWGECAALIAVEL